MSKIPDGWVRQGDGSYSQPKPIALPESALETVHAPVEKERDLHDEIEKELKRRRWYYVHSRFDRPTTTALGAPDFIIAAPQGKNYYCEIKRKGGKLSPEQVVVKHILLGLSQNYKVIFSFREFIDFINEN